VETSSGPAGTSSRSGPRRPPTARWVETPCTHRVLLLRPKGPRRPPTARLVETASCSCRSAARCRVLAVHRRRGGLNRLQPDGPAQDPLPVLAVHRRRGGLKLVLEVLDLDQRHRPRRPPTARWVETSRP